MCGKRRRSLVLRKSVIDRIEVYFNKAVDLLKYSKRSDYEQKLKEMQEHAEKTLFDICTCKCPTLAEGTCNCRPKERKVPQREIKFLLDQRMERKMAIGSVDEEVAQQNLRRLEREARTRLQSSTSAAPMVADDVAVAGCGYEYEEKAEMAEASQVSSSTSDSSAEDPTYKDSKGNLSKTQMRAALPTFASAAYRTGISSRKATLLASALLEDMGSITKDDLSLVVDKSKIYRAKLKVGKEVQQKDAEDLSPVVALFFDGRKDSTLVNEKVGNTYHRRKTVEEHISLIQEPGSVYIGHTTPLSGKGAALAASITKFFRDHNITLDHLLAAGFDGTPANTGAKDGGLIGLEREIGRALQWLICLLHFNELPLRHLVIKLDGKTTGPNSFSGPIGKAISTCEKKPVVNFTPIPAPWTESVEDVELSTDQSYLLAICKAVSSGICDQSLANRDPG